MDKKDKILTSFAEEMQRHNSVKRLINRIGQTLAMGWVLLFVILAVYLILCPLVDRLRPLTKTYQYEAP